MRLKLKLLSPVGPAPARIWRLRHRAFFDVENYNFYMELIIKVPLTSYFVSHFSVYSSTLNPSISNSRQEARQNYGLISLSFADMYAPTAAKGNPNVREVAINGRPTNARECSSKNP